MSDAPADAPATEPEAAPTGDDAPDLAAEVARLQGELSKARKWEDRAKTNAEAAKELEQFKRQAMSDTEKAVADAKAAGRLEALADVGGRLAAAEIRAAAAGRLTDEQLATLTEGLNLAAFLSDDGEVDQAKVAKFVDGIAPKAEEEEKPQGFPDLGQGARGGSTTALNDPMLRDVKHVLGIR